MKSNSQAETSLFFIIVGVLMIGASCILYMNVKSSIIQRKIKEELNSKTLKMSSDYVIKSLPSIPNLTSVAEPTEVQKARYLINEKKYDKAYKELTEKNSSPFDGRREFFLTMMFYNQKKYDSAIHYGEKCRKIKPRFYQNLTLLASSYENKKQYDKSVELWKDYLKHTKDNVNPWRVVANLSRHLGDAKQAEMYSDSIRKYFPDSKEAKSLPKKIVREDIYRKAVGFFRETNYKKALPLYNEFLELNPDNYGAIESRAFCYFFEKKYKECIADVLTLEKNLKSVKSQVINLKGVAYYNTQKIKKACESFKIAKDMGDKDGISNFEKFCK